MSNFFVKVQLTLPPLDLAWTLAFVKVTATIRLIRDGEKGEGGMDAGGRGRLNTCRYTVTTRMIPALRRAAMRAVLMFQWEVMDNVTRQCPQITTFLKRKESRSGIEPRSFRLPACNALPLGQTGSPSNVWKRVRYRL